MTYNVLSATLSLYTASTCIYYCIVWLVQFLVPSSRHVNLQSRVVALCKKSSVKIRHRPTLAAFHLMSAMTSRA